ncbi:hypothetical protein [Streptomyces sp. A5-4]|uniref:hypothetical protein n=1 Tax=Streptomyces sp. A5-4 TaxID=3384771 RepID=UPI003DAA409C
MTDDMRTLLAAAGSATNPHAHLGPVVAAEVAWGNQVVKDCYVVDWHFGDWSLGLARPFHVDLLRETFRFAPETRLVNVAPRPGGQPGRMSLAGSSFAAVSAPIPPGLVRGVWAVRL